MALAKGFPALALMSESDLSEDFGPFAAALEGALDPIVADFRRQMVSALGIVFRGLADMYAISERVELGRIILPDGWEASNQAVETGATLPLSAAAGTLNMLGLAHVSRGPIVKTSTLVRRINRVATYIAHGTSRWLRRFLFQVQTTTCERVSKWFKVKR